MSLLRDRAGGHARVGYAELLFDLVFVYAVTQLSHTLLADLSPIGVARTALLFLATWWVWNYTAWVTNWLDPERRGVRLMLFALTAAGLVLSMAIPTAFTSGGIAFAAAYAAMQLGRSLFMWRALRGPAPDNAANFARISVWLAASATLWLAGGLVEQTRLALWTAAILVEYLSPTVAFWVPVLGKTRTSTWDVDSAHLAERCALFIIIALGEVILMTGATYAQHGHVAAATAAFALSFVATLSLWWLYFAAAAEQAGARFAAASDVGAMARSAYTYLHVPIVAGIIAFAAGVEKLIAHPDGHSDTATALLFSGGPLMFLAGLAGFRAATGLQVRTIHLVAGGALIAAMASEALLSPIAFAVAVTAILLGLAVSEGDTRQDERSERTRHPAETGSSASRQTRHRETQR